MGFPCASFLGSTVSFLPQFAFDCIVLYVRVLMVLYVGNLSFSSELDLPRNIKQGERHLDPFVYPDPNSSMITPMVFTHCEVITKKILPRVCTGGWNLLFHTLQTRNSSSIWQNGFETVHIFTLLWFSALSHFNCNPCFKCFFKADSI